MEAKGAIELTIDQESMAAAMIGVIEEPECALILRGVRFKRDDGGPEGEPEAGADVKLFGELEGGQHILGED